MDYKPDKVDLAVAIILILILCLVYRVTTPSRISFDEVPNPVVVNTSISAPEVLEELVEIRDELDSTIARMESLNNYLESLPFPPKVRGAGASRGGTPDRVHFNPNNLLEPSNASIEFLNSKLLGTPLEGLGSYYIQAEKLYGVNALFTMYLSVHESGWGRSAIARDKNNIFGYQAYDRDPYNSAKSFDSKGDCIIEVAGHLAHNYLSEGGLYYSGLSIYAVNKRYASDTQWAEKIITSIQRAIRG